MAWKTSGVWKKSQLSKKNDEASFPGLAPPPQKKDAGPSLQYEQLQKDEVIALQAIYGDEFIEHKTTHNVWKVGSIFHTHSILYSLGILPSLSCIFVS